MESIYVHVELEKYMELVKFKDEIMKGNVMRVKHFFSYGLGWQKRIDYISKDEIKKDIIELKEQLKEKEEVKCMSILEFIKYRKS